MAKVFWTDQQVINQLATQQFWNSSTISYAFLTNRSQINNADSDDGTEKAGFSAFNTTQQEIAKLSLATWNDLIAPTIVPGVAGKSNISFANTNTGIEYAHAYLPDDGTIWLNSSDSGLYTPVFGGYGALTYIHEIGHALGLFHMGDYNGEDNDGPSSYQDSTVYSVMSYYGPNESDGEGQVAWGNWVAADGTEYSPQTPMLNDIMAIQHMYGASGARADNTVYGFDSNVVGPMASIYDFSLNENPVLAIYDGGGIDTLNLSGWSTDSTVDLRPGHFSSVNGMENNLSIARGVLIENSITGAGDDSLRVNSVDNFWNGGEGFDTVIFGSDYENYALSYDPASFHYTVVDNTGRESKSFLVNVEAATFSDLQAGLNDLTPSVHRFYNSDNNTHFFTANNDEASTVLQAGMSYEGTQFGRSVLTDSETVEVHRFYHSDNNSHFFTANTEELQSLLNNDDGFNFHYEGIAYLAYGEKTASNTELYRFYNTETKSHFYTADLAEKEHVEITYAGAFQYEGVAYYVDIV